MRYQSKAQLLGLPLLAISLGPDKVREERRGTAHGIIAIGDIAVGAVAVGGVGLGLLAIGGISIGLLSIGGLALGYRKMKLHPAIAEAAVKNPG